MTVKKPLSRRTFLKGAGVSMALPFLDSMVPAFVSELGPPTCHLAYVYVPNGRIMDRWTPKTTGTGFALSPSLQPLAAHRDQMLVVSGLANRAGELRSGEAMDPHFPGNAAWMTAVHPAERSSLGISADQIAAKELGKQTRIASLELSTDPSGSASPYLATLSWRSATAPLPVESNPAQVFERLFGEDVDPDPVARRRRLAMSLSVLDSVSEQVSDLMRTVGASDRAKLRDYLDSVREVEIQARRSESTGSVQGADSRARPVRPAGIPKTYEEHCKLMFDLQVLAFQGDTTRVITFAMACERSGRVFSELGISDGHHALSHHNGDPSMIAKVTQIDLYQSKLFAYFLDRLKATKSVSGTLLDECLIVFGSAFGDGSRHEPANLPLALLGGAAGRLRGGRHHRCPEKTPLANLHLAVLDMAGVAADRLGDSSGKLDLRSP